jgi:tetratricopeptide (TPR) repeat protein
LLWYLTPTDTAKLPEGLYRLDAMLDTSASTLAGGWQGHVSAVPVQVRITAAPATLSPDQQAEQIAVLVAYELWRGNTAQALAYLDARLAEQPDDYNALTLKGDLLAAAGQDKEALALYDQALDAYLAQNPGAEEQPETLLVKRGLLQQKVYNLGRP